MNQSVAKLFAENKWMELLDLCQDKGKLICAEMKEDRKYMRFELPSSDAVKFQWNNLQVLESVEIC